MGRLDDVLVFHPLSPDNFAAIARHMLAESGHRLAKLGIALESSDEAILHLCAQAQKEHNGARPLRRAIAEQVETPAADLLLSGQLQAGQTLRLDVQRGHLLPTILPPISTD